MAEASKRIELSVTVNGRVYERSVEPRLLLTDFLRHELGLTGTHVGCEHGVCGACTILLDDEPVRACLMLTVQADGCRLTTVEGLAPSSESLHPLQEAFWEVHGLQCGFCTPGILISMVAFLRDNPCPTDEQIRAGLSGNLCRCTGYQNIVKAVRLAAERMAGEAPPHARCAARISASPTSLPIAMERGNQRATGSSFPASGEIEMGGEG
jgi:carbon-monoxide dehydrogenase small subunit